jgi:hypothetical protein
MPPMDEHTPSPPRRKRPAPPLWALALGALVALAVAPAAHAQTRASYYFDLSEITGDSASDEVRGWVRAHIARAIDAHAKLVSELGEDAPDPETEPKRFEAYLKKRGLRAFRVHVEVTAYSEEVEQQRPPRSGKVIVARISLRMWGESVPGRVIAFAGDGSSTVKIEVGKVVRPRDREAANNEAIELAVAEALAESIRKLEQPPPSKPQRGRRPKK